jgi:hypothetical protein
LQGRPPRHTFLSAFARLGYGRLVLNATALV